MVLMTLHRNMLLALMKTEQKLMMMKATVIMMKKGRGEDGEGDDGHEEAKSRCTKKMAR